MPLVKRRRLGGSLPRDWRLTTVAVAYPAGTVCGVWCRMCKPVQPAVGHPVVNAQAPGGSYSALVFRAGLTPWVDTKVGEALVKTLASGSSLSTISGAWRAYLAFLMLAAFLPVILGRLRRAGFVRRLFGNIALHENAYDHLFKEKWEPLAGRVAPWAVVQTEDGRSLRGQVTWRTTAPNPPAFVFERVYDVTDPDNQLEGAGWLVINGQQIRRFWLLPPQTPNEKSQPGE